MDKSHSGTAWRSFWQALIRFKKDQITPWIAVRNTAGVVVPLAIGFALGMPGGALAFCTGAINVSYSDSHDPYRQRARKMLAASVLVALAVFAGTLLGRYHLAAIFLAGAAAFAAGMLVALGSTAADLGVITLVMLVVYSALPQTPDRAVYAGLLALAGGLFQTLVSLAMWPVRRYFAERRALAGLFLALSRAATLPVRVLQSPPASAESTNAQHTLAALRDDHSISAERYLMLLNQAERMRLSLLTLGRLRARMQNEPPEAGRFVRAASDTLNALGNSLMAGVPMDADFDRMPTLEALADELRASTIEKSEQEAALVVDMCSQMDALAGQLRSALDLAIAATPSGLDVFERREETKPWRLRLAGSLATLRANLSLDSAAFRHAVRLAVCVALGDAFGRGFGLQRSYWLPMTIAIVLKPDFTATISRGVLRLLGTFAGLVLATLLFHVLPAGVLAQIVLIGAFMFVLRWIGSANYGIFVAAVTALVVLLLALAGVAPRDVMPARAINTVAGGLIALAAYALWPTWERTQVSETLARMLDTYRDYFRSIRNAYLMPDKSFAADLDRSRLAGRLARSNLEASVDRMSAEPGTSPGSIGSLHAMLASSHRLVHALMALESGLTNSIPVRARNPFLPFANDVELTLYLLSSALRGSPLLPVHLPDLRADHRALIHSGDTSTGRYALVNVETDRITNSLNTLSEELLRWLKPSALPHGRGFVD